MLRFAKGHGTGNDFVILPDADGVLPLTPRLVAALCDRRRGLGADGVLRVIRSSVHPDAAAQSDAAEWFMDYWNSDGSHSEMCGNGLRVFARYLVDAGLVDVGLPGGGGLAIATRAGLVDAVVAATGEIAVCLPMPRAYGRSEATVYGQRYPGISVDVGNPHLVCRLAGGIRELAGIDLSTRPNADETDFPAGVNIEFVAPAPPLAGSEAHVRMRVHERGSGETLSCGSGACAVALVALSDAGTTSGRVIVEVPGGRLSVTINEQGCWLAGPAVIIATGTLDPASLDVPFVAPAPASSSAGTDPARR